MAAVVVLWQWRREIAKPEQDYMSLSIVSLALMVILFFVIKRQSQHEPDEVLDGGSFLQLVYGKRVELVKLSDVADVQIQKVLRTTRVILHLRAPTGAGNTVAFYPDQKRNLAGDNEVAVALRARAGGSTSRTLNAG
jgi:hypothetical protein